MAILRNAYDAVVIGAGPVGCVASLALAKRGASVLLCEAQPAACGRLAGEWLHPPAVDLLESLGAGALTKRGYPAGAGFVVHPDDGSDPIALPYRAGSRGASIEHATIVGELRRLAASERNIQYAEHTRVGTVDGQRVQCQNGVGGPTLVHAGIVIDAGGRNGAARRGLAEASSTATATYSRMAGLVLEDAELPREGFGHVFLGGPGPVTAYRMDERRLRVCLDVPLDMIKHEAKKARLWEGFREVLPAGLRRAFREALESTEVVWAINQARPRRAFGREGFVLVGDAVGHHHPLTAAGLTLGFQDAAALAESRSFERYRERRAREGRVPEMLALALYEIFSQSTEEAAAIRRGVFELWRKDADERVRTMEYIAGQRTTPVLFGASFLKVGRVALRSMLTDAAAQGRVRDPARSGVDLVARSRWLLAGALGLSAARPWRVQETPAESAIAREPVESRSSRVGRSALSSQSPAVALERGVWALKRLQGTDGGWEGEVVWNPMLTAQYVAVCHLTRTAMPLERRRRILVHFRRTQLADGTWGMHEQGSGCLFVTTLVYVAARLLGAPANDPLLDGARGLFAREGGVRAIPSWGKLWLALLGLYEWEGVNPVLPEIWALPRWMPVHPSNYYCHTRLIYLGMASLYGERFDPPDAKLCRALRQELFPQGYASVDFSSARHALRPADVFARPGRVLRFAYDVLRQYDPRHDARRRAAIRRELCEHIRFEVRSTDGAFLSPVSGMLSLLLLWKNNPNDPDFRRGVTKLSDWMWEDDVDGTRMAGARSATWDTSFGMQALTAAAPHVDVTGCLARAAAFLEGQQISETREEGHERFFRIDPRGGYCFSTVSHGWPVSDCTAEALVGRLECPVGAISREQATQAVRFILRTQCRDGGFGSYEPRRSMIGLEWMNPAEMFGDSMTESSYVECTASCIAALAAFRLRFPDAMATDLEGALSRAVHRVRGQQEPDGSWKGNWGVHFIYGTMFGVRGLLAAGATPFDPAIRKACDFLIARQKPDGGWGESWRGCVDGRYVDHPESQVIQTAWALATLLVAEHQEWDRIERAARFLASRQNPDGSWPKETPAGVFFRTALLHYDQYRLSFPVWALGLYETRLLDRQSLCERRAS